jgi:hypothetical protein
VIFCFPKEAVTFTFLLLGLAEMELEFVEDDQEIIAVAAKD